MLFKISNFYNIRFFKPNEIPISTAMWDPKWYQGLHVDKRGVINGIREELLSCKTIYDATHDCESCDKKYTSAENCNFLQKYTEYLRSVDFNYILSEFNRVAEEVRNVTHYEGEPNIVLLVHEKEDNPCSERWPLIKVFDEHGIKLENWRKEIA